jgi:hypothetical protein
MSRLTTSHPAVRPAIQRVLVVTGGAVPPTARTALRRRLPKADWVGLDPSQVAGLLATGDGSVDWDRAIAWLRQQRCDAAILLTGPGQSPYTLGYLCYLAGIPLRLGTSWEFGGQVLTHCWPPPQAAAAWDLLWDQIEAALSEEAIDHSP